MEKKVYGSIEVGGLQTRIRILDWAKQNCWAMQIIYRAILRMLEPIMPKWIREIWAHFIIVARYARQNSQNPSSMWYMFDLQSPDNPTPYATTMLIGGSSGESCTKHSEGCSSGTSSPHSDPNQSYTGPQKQTQHAYPQYPPGKNICWLNESFVSIGKNISIFCIFQYQIIGPIFCHHRPNIRHHCQRAIVIPVWTCAMVRLVQRQYDVQSKEHHPECQIIPGKIEFYSNSSISGNSSLLIYAISTSLSMLASSQCSGQSALSCGGNSAGYSPWGPPPHQYAPSENFYNNPIQYPGVNNGNNHRYPMTPTGPQPQPTPLPVGYFHQTPAARSLHNHYPTAHGHAAEYQPFPQNGRKCNGR